MLDRILTPVIAVGLAFLIWLYFRSRDQEIVDGTVPVEVQAVQDQNYAFEQSGPPALKATFTGPPSRIREVKSKLNQGLYVLNRQVTVPEEYRQEPTHEQQIRFEAAEIQGLVPPGVRVTLAQNQPIKVRWRRLAEKELPVFAMLTPELQARIDKTVIQPSKVLVRGPREVLEKAAYLPTKLVDVPADGVGQVFKDKVGLVHELAEHKIHLAQDEVTLTLTLKPAQVTYEVDAPVHFLVPLNFKYKARFTGDRPEKVTLKIVGPARDQRPTVSAFIDLTTRIVPPGLYEEKVEVKLPEDFVLVGVPPRVSFVVETPPRAGAGGTSP